MHAIITDHAYNMVICTMMISWGVQQFMIWAKVRLHNTYWPLILSAFFLKAFYIILLRQFFQTAPQKL